MRWIFHVFICQWLPVQVQQMISSLDKRTDFMIFKMRDWKDFRLVRHRDDTGVRQMFGLCGPLFVCCQSFLTTFFINPTAFPLSSSFLFSFFYPLIFLIFLLFSTSQRQPASLNSCPTLTHQRHCVATLHTRKQMASFKSRQEQQYIIFQA